MNTPSNRTFGQRIIELSELSRKKYFFWTAFVGAFPTFVFFYLISPLLQTKIGDFQYDTMAFLISCLISTLTVTFFVSCSLDYMKYSPRVYGAVTNRTYVALAKNRFVRDIFGLFAESVDEKLNRPWNDLSTRTDQNTERLDGQAYEIKNLREDISKLKENEPIYMEEIRRLNIELTSERIARKKAESELRELKEKDSTNKQQIGQNIQATDITENTKVTDLDDKFD